MSRIIALVSHAGGADALADLAAEHDLSVVGPRDARSGAGSTSLTHAVDIPARSRLSAATDSW